MRPLHHLKLPALALLFTLLVVQLAALASEAQPIDVLRAHVSAGIAVLNNDGEDSAEDYTNQQQQLCAIAHEMFDIYAFSRLVVADNWSAFSSVEQNDFVATFGEFLCRYYLSRLQAHYSNEQVSFTSQSIKSPNRAVVSVTVRWRNTDVPIEVRMALRDNRWRAYDIVMAGISGVMLYRAEFQSLFARSSPQGVLDELRSRVNRHGLATAP